MKTASVQPVAIFKFEPLNPWREAALLGLMLMELSWITPWFQAATWITASYPTLRTFLVLGGALLGANLFARLVNALHLKSSVRQWVLFGFMLVYVLLANALLVDTSQGNNLQALIKEPAALTPQFDVMMAGNIVVGVSILLIAWRGIVLAREYAGPISIFESLRLGIILLTAYSLLVAGPSGTNPTGYVVLFLSSGLLAMVSARIAVLSRLRGGMRHSFDRKWFFGITAAITVILTAALAFAEFLLGQMERIARVLQAAYVLFVMVIAAPLLFLLSLLNPQFPTLTLVQPTPTPEGDLSVIFDQAKLDNTENLAGESLLAGLAPYLKLLIVWGVILFVLYILARQFKNWTLSADGEDDTDRQSLLGPGGLRRLFGLNLRKAAHNLGENLANFRRLRSRERLLAADRIRQIYTHLIDLAAELGKPRSEADTPLEYLSELKVLFPTSEQDLIEITEAYLRVRYGQFPETQAEVEIVENAWQIIMSLGEEQIKALKAAMPVQRGTAVSAP